MLRESSPLAESLTEPSFVPASALAELPPALSTLVPLAMPPLTNARVLFNKIPVGVSPSSPRTCLLSHSRPPQASPCPARPPSTMPPGTSTSTYSPSMAASSSRPSSSASTTSSAAACATPPSKAIPNPPSSASRKLPSLPLKPCSLPRLTQLMVAHAPARSLNGFGVVLCSEHPIISPGAHIYSFFPFQEYAVFPPLHRLHNARAGEQGAPPVERVRRRLRHARPDRAPHLGRVRPPQVGMISTYNSEAPYPVKNLIQIAGVVITLSGFVVMSLRAKYAEMPRLITEGRVQYMEDRVHGLAEAGRALVDMVTGRNRGKSVVVVAEE
ncbi:hypothetical protein AcV7_007024 [Taiwanofungus camphoratus]|nr:hypothetical protein AcV7_007024 [Antrodia cinnamomea]